MEAREKLSLIKEISECIKEACELDSDDSQKDEILLGLASLGEKVASAPTKRRKRPWQREWRKEKGNRGSFAFFHKELLVQDEDSYRNYLRVSKTQFDFLLSLIRDDIQRSDTCMRSAIPAEEKLSLTLRFLVTGETYVSLDYQTTLSKSSICGIVPEVCNAIFRRLKPTCLKFPSSPEDWEDIQNDFANKWQFPNCLGALDGKHITFRSPRKDGAFSHNNKGSNSIILLALVDAHCKFIFIDIGRNGHCNNAGVYMNSKLSTVLEEENSLPPPCCIGKNRRLPYVVVADSAFPLQKHLMKPYKFHSNCVQKQIYNKRLSRARQVVDHAFAMLSNRFRVFLTPMSLKVETVQVIVLACCALHNYLWEMGETLTEEDAEVAKSLRSDNSKNFENSSNGEAENIRHQFLKYFNEEGRLDRLNSN